MPLFNQTKNFIFSQSPQLTGLFAQSTKQMKKTTKLFSSNSEIEKLLPKKGGATLVYDLTNGNLELFENFISFFGRNDSKVQTCIFFLSDEGSGLNLKFFDKVLNSGTFDLVYNADIISLNDFEKIVTQSESIEQVESDVKIQFPNYYKSKEMIEKNDNKEKEQIVDTPISVVETLQEVETAQVSELTSHEYQAIIDEKDKEFEELKIYSEQQEKYMDKAEEDIKDLKIKLSEKNNTNDSEQVEALQKERDDLLQKIKDLKKKLSENSVFADSLDDLKADIKKLKQEKNSFKQRAEKAEAMCNMDSPESSIVEIVSTMRHLSDILSKSGQKLDNKAGKEVKELKKQVTQLENEKEATDQIKNSLRELLVN